jgi:hypothetical protein
MMNPTNYVEVSSINLDSILEFMSTKSVEEKNAFKVFASTEIEDFDKDGIPYIRKPCFFEIRNWVINQYFPTCYKKNTVERDSMYDKIMKL